MTRNLASLAVIGLSAALVAGCGQGVGDDNSTRNDAGEVVEGGEVGALRLQVGDCLLDEAVGEVETVPVVPCDQPHDTELFHAFDLDGDEFPGTDTIVDVAQTTCLEEFEGFVGAAYATSIYDIYTIYPTAATWNRANDREVMCGVYLVDGTQSTGTAGGSGE